MRLNELILMHTLIVCANDFFEDELVFKVLDTGRNQMRVGRQKMGFPSAENPQEPSKDARGATLCFHFRFHPFSY